MSAAPDWPGQIVWARTAEVGATSRTSRIAAQYHGFQLRCARMPEEGIAEREESPLVGNACAFGGLGWETRRTIGMTDTAGIREWKGGTVDSGGGVPFHRLDGSGVIGLAHGEGPKRLHVGLTVRAVDALRAWLGVSAKELASVLCISDRTLSRRRKSGERLGLDEGDRVLRLARLCEMAESALSGAERGARWMREPHPLLEGEAPMRLARTEPGVRQVESLLASIEYSMPV